MFGGQRRSHLIGRQAAVWVCFQGIEGRHNLLPQPCFHDPIANQKGSQAVADDLAFGRVFSRRDLGTD
jgi:hypothetical protein